MCFCGEYVVSRGLREGNQYGKVCACECVCEQVSNGTWYLYTPYELGGTQIIQCN